MSTTHPTTLARAEKLLPSATIAPLQSQFAHSQDLRRNDPTRQIFAGSTKGTTRKFNAVGRFCVSPDSAKSQWRYIRYAVTLGSLLHLPAMSAGLTLDFEIPALQVAEYHKPYIAVWIERPDQSVATTLTVWYDLKKPNAEGTKWLKDLRQWWRRTGRDLELPIDGVSSPTRPAGKHQIRVNEKSGTPFQLAAGQYTLMIEASREVGGRELLSLPFEWPPQKTQTSQIQGNTELGKIQLEIKP